MRIAYVDTSFLLAIAFQESDWSRLTAQLARFDDLIASNLLVAEFLAALHREEVVGGRELTSRLQWVIPHRNLNAEIERVLATGYQRGADCWHLACALYVADNPAELTFLSLDARQRSVAKKIGFRT